MRDRGFIYSGLFIFLGVITFPIWWNVANGTSSKPPVLKLPANEKQCVAPLDYMKTSHMALLITWREDVVRRGIRKYTAFDGKTYRMSLSRTCLQQCHGTRTEFCDRCHNYAAVSEIYCWNCHNDYKPSQLVARRTR